MRSQCHWDDLHRGVESDEECNEIESSRSVFRSSQKQRDKCTEYDKLHDQSKVIRPARRSPDVAECLFPKNLGTVETSREGVTRARERGASFRQPKINTLDRAPVY
jgi:hypothetical protein